MARVKIDPSLVRRIVDDVNPREILKERFWDDVERVAKNNLTGDVRIKDAVKVNRKVINSVKQLEARGEIPAKTARRMIDAVKWQNTIDTAPEVYDLMSRTQNNRASRRFQTQKPNRLDSNPSAYNRPAIGKTTRLTVSDGLKPVKVKMRGGVQSFDGWIHPLTPDERVDLLSRAIGNVRTSKPKVKKPNKEKLIGMMRDSLNLSQLRQLNRGMRVTRSSLGNKWERVPSTKRDKAIASMANKYRELRNKYDEYSLMPLRHVRNAWGMADTSLKDIIL